jgi:fucose 4-O-acetylase-like acetyltransferase
MNQNTKIDSMIMIRAIAVMLVVLGHCTLISSHYDQLSTYKYIPSYTPHSEALLRKYIYSFHMPLFSGFQDSFIIIPLWNVEKILNFSTV